MVKMEITDLSYIVSERFNEDEIKDLSYIISEKFNEDVFRRTGL